MTSDELRARLSSAQQSIAAALGAGEVDQLLTLVTEREDDIHVLASRVGADPELRTWAAAYLERDRAVLAAAQAAREDAAAKLRTLHRNKSVHRTYLSEGSRR